MAENRLPKNMGKKIADALKSQSMESGAEFDDNTSNEPLDEMSGISLEDFLDDTPAVDEVEVHRADEPLEVDYVGHVNSDKDDFYKDIASRVDLNSGRIDDIEVKTEEIKPTPLPPPMPEVKKPQPQPQPQPKPMPKIVMERQPEELTMADELKLSIDLEEEEAEEEFEMPNNISVLKRLILQLPPGVPKQTGAQIIRQTIEALGIPMKSVLQDAQKVRDCLNSSIKDCAFTIQEYKSNIKNLEKQTLSYQRQITKLNDIIGLFIYNDKK